MYDKFTTNKKKNKKKDYKQKHENYERKKLINKGKYQIVNQTCSKLSGKLKEKSGKNHLYP